MNTTGFINLLCLTIISFNLSGQELISERAKKDQIASKLWNALGSNLTDVFECNKESAIDMLGNKFQLPNDNIKTFLTYMLNYSSLNLETEQVLYRYPHYNEDSIRYDFSYLTDLGLLEEGSIGWDITNKGTVLKNEYWQNEIEKFASCKNINNYLLTLILIADKLNAEYEKMEVFQSIRLRIQNRPDSIDKWPLVLRANEFQRDLTAVFNDNGHYRIDFLISSNENKKWKELRLGPLAKELLGATRNNRIYPINRCSSQPNWRVGEDRCNYAIHELIEAGLVELKNDSISQTADGKELFQEADLLADNRLYSAWRTINTEEYENLLKALDWITKSNK